MLVGSILTLAVLAFFAFVIFKKLKTEKWEDLWK